ncbi:MAG: Rho termination factor N-terminal domain-containing protein, partial [Clostridiales bacterium]|nr:Rho termination factor N-terminal domain-containing protein [Clostridiales bacterium]
MNLEELGIIELKKIAKEAGVKSISKYKKAELVSLIRRTESYEENSADAIPKSAKYSDASNERLAISEIYTAPQVNVLPPIEKQVQPLPEPVLL